MSASAFESCLQRLLELHRLMAEGKGDSEEADSLREEMDVPWNDLSLGARTLLSLCSAALYGTPENEAWIRSVLRPDLRECVSAPHDVALKKAREDLAELERVFALQRDAEKRAVEMWRARDPSRELVLPDRANLVVFLLEELEVLKSGRVK